MDKTFSKDCVFIRRVVDFYVDGSLPKPDATFVSMHVRTCDSCSRLLDQARATRDALRSLGQRQVPSTFDARLAARIEAIDQRRSAPWAPLRGLWQPGLWTGVLRPSLAVAMVALIVSAGFVTHRGSTRTASRGQEAALVSQCVAQHQTLDSGQALTDWSAQNLAGTVNGLAPDGTDDSL